jgi:hypothetical protein
LGRLSGIISSIIRGIAPAPKPNIEGFIKPRYHNVPPTVTTTVVAIKQFLTVTCRVHFFDSTSLSLTSVSIPNSFFKDVSAIESTFSVLPKKYSNHENIP